MQHKNHSVQGVHMGMPCLIVPSTITYCPALLLIPALQYIIIDLPSTPPLLLRVVVTNTLTAEEQQEALGYHCFRYVWGGE